MREELLIPIFLKKALNGEALTVSGDGSQFRKFVYVKDMARAHILALGEKAVNQTYNLEGPQQVTVLEVAERIRGLVGEHVEIERTPARPGDFAGREVSAQKVADELGWRCETDFEAGLKSTVEWFMQRWGAQLAGNPAGV
jgi:UDP-glucose 4-epimerase